MAKLTSLIGFTGSLDGMTAYKLPGVDGIVVRRSNPVTGDQIRYSPEYQNTRKNNSEFRGRAVASGWIMRMMRPVSQLADYSIGGAINALMKPVQECDAANEWGKRDVRLSKNKNLLQGFTLNQKYPLDHIVRTMQCKISREDHSASVSIPALINGLNFFPSPLSHMFSIVVVLGVVPDLTHDNSYAPSHEGYLQLKPVVTCSPWFPSADGSPSIDLTLQLPSSPPDENYTLILTAGVRYGMMSVGNTVKQKKKAGCGKIVMLA